MNSSLVVWGIALAVLSGLMNGTFTLPMRYLGRWSWENVWTVFVVVSCLVMPLAIMLTTVTHPLAVLSAAPGRAEVIAIGTGFAWGFGAVMFGQGVSALGISMGNTLVLAISASLGSFLPILILAPERLCQPQGEFIMLGTAVAMAGIGCCGYAGILRERGEKEHQVAPREMVGTARPLWAGLLLCSGAGLLSALFNIGYSLSQGIIASAVRLGNGPFAGSNVIWLLVLASGAVSNLGFCGYLFRKNRSWSNFRRPGSAPLYGLAILMGLLWGGSIFVYGSAAPKLGKLGPAIGWPISLTAGLLTANFCGLLAGEWKLAQANARRWMIVGLAILLCSIGVLGWSGSVG
jgi:L-rhamnose-H+ transport protein